MKAFLKVVEFKVNDIITTSEDDNVNYPGLGENDGIPDIDLDALGIDLYS